MPAYKVSDYFAAKPDIFLQSDFVIVATCLKTQTIIAALSAKWVLPETLDRSLNLTTILIGTAFQKTRLIHHLFSVLLHTFQNTNEFPKSFSIKTTNPVSYNAFRGFSRIKETVLHPVIGSQAAPLFQHERDLIESVAQHLGSQRSFDWKHSVFQNGSVGVPDDFYPSFPACKSSAINEYFLRHVWPNHRLLAVLFLRKETAQAALIKSLAVQRLKCVPTVRALRSE